MIKTLSTVEPTLKILGVTLDRDLSFKPHVTVMLKKAYAKIAALRLDPSDVVISLYKAYVLPHLEYCCPLTKYNLRGSGLNVVQPPYNSLVMLSSYLPG